MNHNIMESIYNCHRFGKVLWGDLPEDVLACQEPWRVKEFADFVFGDPNYIRTFNTE